jgi:soluble lytic murein transglycosylase-like protein
MRPQPLVLAALTALLACGATRGDEVVVFEDGRTLEVQRIEHGPQVVVLELAGGGTLAVPASRIARTVARSVEAPPQPAAAPPPVEPAPLWRAAAGSLADLIGTAADRHRLEPALLVAVAHVESRFDPSAVSPKGAAGLLQLMPATAERFGVADVFDVAQNVEGGARYLSWLLARFDGRTELALAGYNAGEQVVERYRGIPPYAETRDYVSQVLQQLDRLSGRH